MVKMRKRDAYLDDEIARDGETIRTPLFLKDGRDHQPHFLRVTDEGVRDARREARDARQEWIRDLSSAWRRRPHIDATEPDAATELLPRRDVPGPDERIDPDGKLASMRREYQRRCRELENAWRSPAGAAAPVEAERVERQRKRWTAER
jgi:hypothetical protein